MIQTNRRRVLCALGAAGLVAGFDPLTRRWIPAAHAASGAFDPLPPILGEVRTDDDACDAATGDNGFFRRLRPRAVLRPVVVNDIAVMIRYCRRRGIPVAPRGEAHSIYGQSQVAAGLCIDMSTLNRIRPIRGAWADVEAGVLWNELLDAALEHGFTPPALTGFIAMTVGGTLSVGGVSVRNKNGLQIDHVRRLQVVTGTGDVCWCSETLRPDLFEAVLGGVGQFGIITRAVIELIPAPTRSRTWVLQYFDPAKFFTDFRAALDGGTFDCVHGSVVPPSHPSALAPSPSAEVVRALGPLAPALNFLTPILGPLLGLASDVLSVPPGVWVYQLTVTRHYEPGDAPDGRALLQGTSDVKLLRFYSDQTYRDYILRVDVLVDLLKTIGLWHDVPHPWIDVFLAGSVAEEHVTRTVSAMKFDDVGEAGLILLLPVRRANHRRRLFKMPEGDDEWIILFDVLTSAPAPGPNARFLERKLARNRRLYEAGRDVGGKLYVISAVEMQPEDWKHEFGANHDEVVALKRLFDPDGILTPTPGIFAV